MPHTVVDGLLLLDLCLVAVEDGAQAVADLGDDALACAVEFGEVVGLLHERVEGANLEVGDREARGGTHVIRHRGAQGRQSFVGMVAGRYRRRQRHQQVF